MKFDALCDFVEEELLDIKKRVMQVENGKWGKKPSVKLTAKAPENGWLEY